MISQTGYPATIDLPIRISEGLCMFSAAPRAVTASAEEVADIEAGRVTAERALEIKRALFELATWLLTVPPQGSA